MHHHTLSHGHGSSRLLVLALTGLLTLTWLDLTRCHARRRLERTPPAKPETLQTWEGEGGRPSDSDDHAPELHPEPLPHVAGSQSLQH